MLDKWKRKNTGGLLPSHLPRLAHRHLSSHSHSFTSSSVQNGVTIPLTTTDASVPFPDTQSAVTSNSYITESL